MGVNGPTSGAKGNIRGRPLKLSLSFDGGKDAFEINRSGARATPFRRRGRGIGPAAGFERVEQAPSMANALKRLLSGRNELMAAPEPYFEDLLKDGAPVLAAVFLPAMRAAMASLIADGTQASIIARHN